MHGLGSPFYRQTGQTANKIIFGNCWYLLALVLAFLGKPVKTVGKLLRKLAGKYGKSTEFSNLKRNQHFNVFILYSSHKATHQMRVCRPGGQLCGYVCFILPVVHKCSKLPWSFAMSGGRMVRIEMKFFDLGLVICHFSWQKK